MKIQSRFIRAGALVAALSLFAAACTSTTEGTVTNLGEDTDSASASSSGSASASAPADEGAAAAPGDGGYEYASNVDSHRLITADICSINDLLPSDAEIDFAAVEAIYRDGENSETDDGSRTIAGFAANEERNPQLQEFFGSATPLDDFITAALEGTGQFEGESDLVRRQGAQKGIQNQTMVAWAIHEFNAALTKAADGDFDPASGAPHNWDEAWAFYHGAEPGCSPFATGNSRAGNFGTVGEDGVTALANETILEAMIDGRDALLAEDAAGAEAAVEEAVRGLVIIYSQATLRYAQVIDDDLAEGDTETARVHQAEGLAFSRVMADVFAANGADTDAIFDVYSLENEPSEGGFAIIETALQPAWDSLGITAVDIGVLEE